MLIKKKKLKTLKESEKVHASTYSMRYFEKPIPKFKMPEKSMPANAAYQLVHDEMNMDGNPALNLASFVTTWMEPEAIKIIEENLHKNFIDRDEYPQTEVINERCVNMIARLFNAPENGKSVGSATIGSSEAIMLALLSHKFAWRKKRKAQKKPHDKPNIVFGADSHICWDKFARYFDVEPRIVPMTKKRYITDVKEIEKRIDENTICVGAILGTSFTGQADPIKEINDLLVKIKKRKGWDIPMHVDGASGGFVAPFAHPNLLWDFRLPQVKSINASGHKYGLVYPGIGWVIWRDEKDLPKDIIFNVNYMGGELPTFTLNFSRGSSMVLAQYYNFLRLGKEGYKKIIMNTLKNARYLAKKLSASGKFEMINPAKILPVLGFKLKRKEKFTLFDLSAKMRERGWIIPAFTLPPNAEDVTIMRIVCREHLSRDMVDLLYADILKAFDDLKKSAEAKERKGPHIC